MASLALGVVGSALGGPIGGFIGSTIGRYIDQELFGDKVDSPKVDDIPITGASPGNPIPRVYGKARVPGQFIWAGELVTVEGDAPGKGGDKGTPDAHYRDVAVAVCSGPVTAITRIWADGKVIFEEPVPDSAVELALADLTDVDLTLEVGPNTTFYWALNATDSRWPTTEAAFSEFFDPQKIYDMSGWANGANNSGVQLHWRAGQVAIMRVYPNPANVDLVKIANSDEDDTSGAEVDGEGNRFIAEIGATVTFSQRTTIESRYENIRIYLGTETQGTDPLIATAMGAAFPELGSTTIGFRGLCYVMFQQLYLNQYGGRLPIFEFEVVVDRSCGGGGQNVGGWTAAHVIADLAERAGVDPGLTGIVDGGGPVRGLSIATAASPRQVFETLRAVYPIEVAETSEGLRVISRRAQPTVKIYEKDFGAVQKLGEVEPLTRTTRASDLEMPYEVDVKYNDIDRDYQSNNQRARREIASSGWPLASRKRVVIDTPVVMTSSLASKAAWEMMGLAYMRRRSLSLRAPFKYALLDAGDMVRMVHLDGEERDYLVDELGVTSGGIVEITLTPNDVLYWAWDDPGFVVQKRSGLTFPIPSDGMMLNLPGLSNAEQDFGFYFIAYPQVEDGDWTRANLYRDPGDGVFDNLGTVAPAATHGIASTTLGGASEYYIDRTSTLTVVLERGTLQSVAEADLFTGKNYALIGSEIIQFAGAIQTGANTYDLTILLRGRHGTEKFIGTHGASELFVLLDGAVVRFDDDAENKDASLDCKIQTPGQALTDLGPVAFINTCRALRPWTVTNVQSSRDGDDLTVTWDRRDRKGQWSSGAGLPLSEDTEEYVVRVFSGSTEVNEYTVTSPSWAYSSAEQTADLGAPSGSISIKIHQMSAQVGRGIGLQATV
ncbi:MAG: phage tail protein [Magnetospiraceae bacterium]